MFSALETALIALTHTVPLPVFVFIASIVEEVIAPIPSATVMLVSGAIAFSNGYTIFALIPLVIMGSLGKTVGAFIVYTIADRVEDVTTGRLGRYFGIATGDIERFGTRVGTGIRGFLTLTLFRALPFIPSVLVSIGGGVLKVPVPLFLVSTFLGTIVRDSFYIYVGYAGVHMLKAVVAHADSIETFVEVAVVILILLFLGYRWYTKRRVTDLH